MSFRSWSTIITLVLLSVVVFLGWDKIVEAWDLMDRVDLRIFLLILPVQILSYFTTGEALTSYLRSKGNLNGVSRLKMTRLAVEANFVNHIVPVPGAAGFSYLSWVLHHHKVSVSRSTMSQIVYYVLIFVSFICTLSISTILLSFDPNISKNVITLSSFLIFVTVVLISSILYIIGSHNRIIKASRIIARIVNSIARFVTKGKKRNLLKVEIIEKLFTEIHQDYIEISKDKRILIRPFFLTIISNISDTMLVFIVFMSLGAFINPAVMFIAFGLSSIASFFAATPGGSGVYEAIMIGFLSTAAGIPVDVAIAGTLLARATLLVITIIFGYTFYQLTINKYGKISDKTII